MSKNQKVIGVLCNFSGSVLEIPYYEDDVSPGEKIIFKDAEDKEEFGTVKYVNRDAVEPDKILLRSKVLRKATLNDAQKVENYNDMIPEATESCKKLIEKHELLMQVFRVGFSFDGGKVHFMFTADDRVDFRELVKDLAKVFKKQIYLRQVGPRDKAKITGGFGKCGRELCCYTFLNKLESINMEMVRDQGLESKGSSKLSGACGKLLCCLKYEVFTYKELKKTVPDVSSVILLKKSSPYQAMKGDVIGLDILNQKVKVILENKEYAVIDVAMIDKVLQKPRNEQSKSENLEINE